MKKIGTIVIILIMTLSCNNTFKDSNELISTTKFDITEAQKFFEDEYSAYSLTRSAINDKTFLSAGEFTPLWSDAKFYQRLTKDCFYVPIIPQYKYRAIRSNFHNGKSTAYIVNVTQFLVIDKDNLNSELSYYILTLVPKKKILFNSCATRQGEMGNYSGLAICSYCDIIVAVEEFENGISIMNVTNVDVLDDNEIAQNGLLMTTIIEDIKFQYSDTIEQDNSDFENSESYRDEDFTDDEKYDNPNRSISF